MMSSAGTRDFFQGLHDTGGSRLFSRLQYSVSQRVHQLVTKASAPATVVPPPSCTYMCMFVPTPLSKVETKAKVTTRDDMMMSLEGFEELTLHIASFLDGRAVGRMMLVNSKWKAFVSTHREVLFKALNHNEFDTFLGPRQFLKIELDAFKTYLFSLRHALDQELAHCCYIHKAHAAIEHYCTAIEPENHGFVAMFCDIVQFRDPRIARFVAHRRHEALSMVIAATPEHVQDFRRVCADAGPIAFVPFDNPHWPKFDLPKVEFPGFLGYAFDHVEVVKGYEGLKNTVIKSILKELMLFDTPEDAAAYGVAVGKAPYAAILGIGGNEAPVPTSKLMFTNPLREELRHMSIKERIAALMKRITAVDRSISQYVVVRHDCAPEIRNQTIR